ncbi:hypothetical protein [Streptomyces sp. NPDC088746]|uniref:hypothetical protein n=1 Tax=Streptomyces sp. NPDC088746 TaxID=3365885 RepID=UPI0037F2B6C4
MDDTITIRCTTAIDGCQYTCTMPVPRALWDDSSEEWRSEFLDTCRDRTAVYVRHETGVELTEQQTAGIAVALDRDEESEVLARLVTVTLFGGPLDGETVAVDLADPEPGIGIIAAGCSYPGGRSWYEPGADGRWAWKHDIPWGKCDG